jgi:hypothetical protein
MDINNNNNNNNINRQINGNMEIDNGDGDEEKENSQPITDVNEILYLFRKIPNTNECSSARAINKAFISGHIMCEIDDIIAIYLSFILNIPLYSMDGKFPAMDRFTNYREEFLNDIDKHKYNFTIPLTLFDITHQQVNYNIRPDYLVDNIKKFITKNNLQRKNLGLLDGVSKILWKYTVNQKENPSRFDDKITYLEWATKNPDNKNLIKSINQYIEYFYNNKLRNFQPMHPSTEYVAIVDGLNILSGSDWIEGDKGKQLSEYNKILDYIAEPYKYVTPTKRILLILRGDVRDSIHHKNYMRNAVQNQQDFIHYYNDSYSKNIIVDILHVHTFINPDHIESQLSNYNNSAAASYNLKELKQDINTFNTKRNILDGGKKIHKKTKKNKKTKKVRKHQGIIQTGGNTGRLKKGYRYSGKKLKSGLPQIIKCKSKKC